MIILLEGKMYQEERLKKSLLKITRKKSKQEMEVIHLTNRINNLLEQIYSVTNQTDETNNVQEIDETVNKYENLDKEEQEHLESAIDQAIDDSFYFYFDGTNKYDYLKKDIYKNIRDDPIAF